MLERKNNRMIKHEYTRNIVCPYCGYEDINSWEEKLNEEFSGLIECGSCDKCFYVERHITVKYSTEKARYGTCQHCAGKDVLIGDHRFTIGTYEDLCTECGYKEEQRLRIKYMEDSEREGGY